MRIIKEYCEETGHIVLRTNTYARSVGHIVRLFEEAKKDFPELIMDECNIDYYAGVHHARTYGMLFKAKNAPENYFRINRLEQVY